MMVAAMVAAMVAVAAMVVEWVVETAMVVEWAVEWAVEWVVDAAMVVEEPIGDRMKLFWLVLSVALIFAPVAAQNRQSATGSPTVSAKRYEVIKLNYAYAPGIASVLGGHPLYYYQIDPWISNIGGLNSGGFGGGSFGGNNGGFGSQRGGFGTPGGGFGNGFDGGTGRRNQGW